jgi:TPR repeat protein
MHWCIKAANNGNADAMNGVDWMYHFGQGVAKNVPTAVEWYTKAAKQGNSKAQNNLGYLPNQR